MSTATKTLGPRIDPRLSAALAVLAFLSPGAWLVITLPAQPIARFLHLATLAGWLGCVAWLAPRLRLVGRPLLLAVAGVVAAAAVSLAANPFPIQQLLYDVYGEMPGLVWLAYPVMFLAAASLGSASELRPAVRAVVIAGGILAAVMFVWRWSVGLVTVFGSPAYSIPAMSPVPFLALGLAATSPKHRSRYLGAAALIAAALAYAGGGFSAIYTLGVGLLVVLAVAPELVAIPERLQRAVRIAGAAVLAVVLVAVLAVQFPETTGAVVDLSAGKTAEQSVATRIYLWEGAQRMTAERPVLGYGPAGYRLSAVDFYDPGVFSFIAAAGSDPTAYSAPSPHSILWELLTRLGIVGLAAFVALFAVWWRERGTGGVASEPLRLALTVGFLVHLVSLTITPAHFASGFLGAVMAGFAVSSPTREPLGERAVSVVRILAIALAVVFAVYGGWLMYGQIEGSIGGQSLAEDSASVTAAARVIPGEPLNERRRLELGLYAAAGPGELQAAREAVDAAPGYITRYTPNLAGFAAIGLSRAEVIGVTDLSWERGLLERAAAVQPELPSVVAEQLHLAVLERDTSALPELVARANTLAGTYPATADYVARAEGLLGGE